MPIDRNYRPRYGAYASTNPNNYDPETVAMMKELGIWHPGLVLNKTLAGGHPNPEYAMEQEALGRIQQMRAHKQGIDENTTARREAREDYATQRADAAKLMEQGRNDRAKELAELRRVAEEDRRTQGLVAGMHETYGTPAYDALKNEYFKRLGVNIDAAKPKGEFGLSGATNVATAPTPYAMPERTPIRGATAAPSGYDYNLNTGEFVRKDQPQFVNGRQIGGTAPSLNVLNPPTREDMIPSPVDFYGIHPAAPVVAGVDTGSPFDQFIRNILPRQNVPRRIPGVRQNWEYLTPEEQKQQELVAQ